MNRKVNYLIVGLLLGLNTYCWGQTAVRLGIEVGPAFGIYTLASGEEEEIMARPVPGLLSGLTISILLKERISLGSGLYLSNYRESFSFATDAQLESYSGATLLQIPLRIQYAWFVKAGMSIAPSLAFVLAHNKSFFKNSSGDLADGTEQDIVSVSWVSHYNFQRYYSFGELGLYLQYQIRPKLALSLRLNYLQGFALLHSRGISYKINDEPIQFARTAGKGNNFAILLGFHLLMK